MEGKAVDQNLLEEFEESFKKDEKLKITVLYFYLLHFFASQLISVYFEEKLCGRFGHRLFSFKH